MDKIICKIKDKTKNVCTFFIVNPHNHWRLLARIFLILVIALIGFSFYLFFQIKNEQVYEINKVSPNKKVLLKEKLLKQVVDSFDAKEKRIIELKGEVN